MISKQYFFVIVVYLPFLFTIGSTLFKANITCLDNCSPHCHFSCFKYEGEIKQIVCAQQGHTCWNQYYPLVVGFQKCNDVSPFDHAWSRSNPSCCLVARIQDNYFNFQESDFFACVPGQNTRLCSYSSQCTNNCNQQSPCSIASYAGVGSDFSCTAGCNGIFNYNYVMNKQNSTRCLAKGRSIGWTQNYQDELPYPFQKINGTLIPRNICSILLICGPYCYRCSDDMNCLECLQGSTLVINSQGKNQCQVICNVKNCERCILNYVCEKCIHPFIVNSLGICELRQCNIEACIKCQQPNVCVDCKTGYEIDSNICVIKKCPVGMIFNGVQCICPNGKIQKNSQCVNCTNNCQKCNVDSCLQCKKSYYLSNNLCIKCRENCISCSDSTSCNLCSFGHFFNSTVKQCAKTKTILKNIVFAQNNTVFQCSFGCMNCKKQILCENCLPGYYLLDSVCKKCSENCFDCNQQLNYLTCKKCFDGYFLKENKCIKCQEKNCLQCHHNFDICTQCLRGYFLKNYKCQKCQDQYCEDCNKEGICTKCYKGYSLMNDGICTQCLSGCDQCQKNNLSSCLKCLQGTYLSQKKCEKCQKGCFECQNQTKCIICNEGYHLNTNNTCIKQCTDVNCFKCGTQPNQCEKCFSGYNLSKNKICLPSIQCNQKKNCIFCPQKYYLSSDKTCILCNNLSNNCNKCDQKDPSTCAQCKNGYYLSILRTNSQKNNSCLPCVENCFHCLSDNFCLKCKDGYFNVLQNSMSTGECKACHKNCLTCQRRSNLCSICKQNYQLSRHRHCLPKNKIDFIIKIDMNFNLYSQNINKISKQLISLASISQKSYLQIQFARDGSTQIKGFIGIDQSSNSKSYEVLSTNLQSGSQLGQFKVISSVFIQTISNNENSQSQSKWILFLIIGSMILIILIITVILINKYCCKQEDQIQNTFQINISSEEMKIIHPHIKKQTHVQYNKSMEIISFDNEKRKLAKNNYK